MEARLKMSQFIAQMFHAGAVTECAAASLYSLSDTLLVLQVNAEQTINIKIHAKRHDGSVV